MPTHPLEVYRFLKENGSGYMQFIPIVERIAHQVTADGLQLISPDFAGAARVAPWSVEPRQFGRFLCAIFDEWVRSDVGRCFVQLFDVSLEIVVRHGGQPVRLPAAMRRSAGHRTLRRPLLVRSFRLPAKPAGQHHGVGAGSAGRPRTSSAASARRRNRRCRVIAASAMCVLPATASAPSIAF